MVILAIVVLLIYTLVVRRIYEDPQKKFIFTLIGLGGIAIVSLIQAILCDLVRVSLAWWIFTAIFVILIVHIVKLYEYSQNTSYDYEEFDRYDEYEGHEKVNENCDKQIIDEEIVEDVDLPPMPPKL